VLATGVQRQSLAEATAPAVSGPSRVSRRRQHRRRCRFMLRRGSVGAGKLGAWRRMPRALPSQASLTLSCFAVGVFVVAVVGVCKQKQQRQKQQEQQRQTKEKGKKKTLPANGDVSGQGSVGGVLSPPLLFPNCAAVFASALSYKGDHRQMGSPGNYIPAAAAAAGVMTDDDDKDDGMEGHDGYGHGSNGQEACQETADDDATAVGRCAHAAVHHAALNLALLCLAFARTHDPRAFVFTGGVFGKHDPCRDDGDNTDGKRPDSADGRVDRGDTSGGDCSWFLLLIERKYRALDWTAGDSALPEFLSASSPNAALVGAAVLASTDTAL